MTDASDGAPRYSAVAARGSAWTLGGLLIGEPVRLITTAVLARLLTPEDFGLVGMASVFVGIAWIGNDMGFTTALIQRPDVTQEERDSVFWLNLIIGFGLFAAAIALAPVVGAAYGDDRVGPIFTALGVSFIISSLFLVQNAQLRRELDFRTTSIAGVVLTSMMGVTGIGYALLGLGYWSLVLGNLTALAMWGIVIQAKTRYIPRHGFRWAKARPYLAMGGELTLGDGLAYVTGNVDNYAVGRSLGASALGIYGLAYNLTSYPMRKIARLIGSVVLPVYSRMNEDRVRLGRAYVSSVRAVALVEFPLLAVLAVEGDRLIVGIYGEAWAGAIPIFRILVVAAAAASLAVFGEMLLKGMGLTRDYLIWTALSMLAVGAGVLVGLRAGVEGVALGVALGWAASSLVLVWYAGRKADVAWGRLVSAVAPALVFTGICAAATYASEMLLQRALDAGLAVGVLACALGLMVPWAILRRFGYFGGIRELEILARRSLRREKDVEVGE